MAFTTANLSLYHSFSKMPAQNSTTLGNAINKSGHTVTASEVWAQDIPYYGKMGSIEDVKSKVQPYARKNDMCYITAGADKGKTFQYDGNGNWTDITATLIDGALIKNANDDVVLLYHKGQTLTNLTAENNANTDSANNAARLWAKRDTEGVAIADNGTRLIEQFVAPTDKALNGLASVAYAPVIANGSLISGTNYYDYCFSGTILWATARTAATLIDCFEYVGQKVSTVVDTVATNAAEIKSVKDQVDTISESLGLGATPGQDTLGSRVSKTESALRTMLGLGTDAELVASQSISKSIQDAIDALGDVAVKSDITITEIKVKSGSTTTTLTPDSNKSVTVEIPEVQAATTDVAGVVKISDNTAIGSEKTSGAALETAATVAAVAATVGEIEDIYSKVALTVKSIQDELSSSGATGKAIAEVKATADSAVQSVTRASGSSDLITVTDGTDVTISLSTEVATKSDAATAASTAITTSLAGTATDTIGGAISSAVSGLETKLTTGEGSLGSKVTALEGSVKTINETTIPNAITTAQNGAVATVKALSLSATDSDDAVKVTVALGGTVETPTITVTTSDIASAQTLATLKSTVETHISEAAGLYLSVEKVDALPADVDAKTNKIYLVPVDTDAGRAQNIHTEYIWTNGQWEIIGTTAIDINSLEASAKAAQDAADKAQGEVDAVEEAIAAMDADLTVNGISVKQVDGTITELSESLITASIPAGTTSVEGNVAYVGSTKHVIAPEKFQTAAQMPATLTSWVADLSNLTNGDNMFKGCTGLTVFVGDLSSLTSGVDMFNGCTLDAESLEILSENLSTVAGGTIDIGASTNATAEVIATIKGKGWTLKSNGAAL